MWRSAALVVSCVFTAFAAAPVLTELEPRGAQRGKSFTLTIAGKDLPEGAQVLSNLPAAFTPLTPAQKDASFKLVAYLAQKYHIAPDHIKGHNSIDPIDRTRCPGNYPWEELWTYLKGATIDPADPTVGQYFTALPDGQWQCKQTGNILKAGMLNFYRSFGGGAYCGLTYLGLPRSNEIPIAEYASVVKQEFERGWLVYDPQHQVDNPPGAGEVYLMHLPV